MWSMAVWGGWVVTLFWSFFDFQRVKTLVGVVCLDGRVDGWGGKLFWQYPQRRGSCYKGALLSATWPAEREPERGQWTLFKTPRMEELHVKMNMKKSLALRLTNAQVFFLISEPIQHNLQEKMDIEIYLNLETPSPPPQKKELGHPKSIILMFILSETENPPEPTTATSSTKTTSSTSSLKTTISTSLWLALAIFRGVLT